jgi:hypothetical protein
MSQRTKQLKRDAKAADWQVRVALHTDDKSGEEHRRAAAHAHVMTHHALELDTPEAHMAAAAAHDKVSQMHEDAADALSAEEDDMNASPSENRSAKGSAMQQSKNTGPK